MQTKPSELGGTKLACSQQLLGQTPKHRRRRESEGEKGEKANKARAPLNSHEGPVLLTVSNKTTGAK